jgi:hypothetical protein
MGGETRDNRRDVWVGITTEGRRLERGDVCRTQEEILIAYGDNDEFRVDICIEYLMWDVDWNKKR